MDLEVLKVDSLSRDTNNKALVPHNRDSNKPATLSRAILSNKASDSKVSTNNHKVSQVRIIKAGEPILIKHHGAATRLQVNTDSRVDTHLIISSNSGGNVNLQ